MNELIESFDCAVRYCTHYYSGDLALSEEDEVPIILKRYKDMADLVCYDDALRDVFLSNPIEVDRIVSFWMKDIDREISNLKVHSENPKPGSNLGLFLSSLNWMLIKLSAYTNSYSPQNLDNSSQLPHKKLDKRLKPKATNSEIAWAFKTIFHDQLERLKKDERVLLFDKLTGKSGANINQLLNGGELLNREKEAIEKELEEIKNKLV